MVSKILSHSKPSTTEDIYGHLTPIDYEGLGDLIDGLVAPIRVEMGEMAEVKQQEISNQT